MAAIIPSNLQLMAGRLANEERTVIRVRPMSNDAVSAGQTIHFRLPTNTLIDLHNLQFFGQCTIDANQGDRVWGLPRKMAQAIERVDIIVNGQSIHGNNSDYGALDHILTSWTHTPNTDYVDSLKDEYLTSGDNKITNMKDAIRKSDAASGSLSAPQKYPSNPDGDTLLPRRFPFLINGLHGFMSGAFVRFIDTAVLGPVELRIRLHNPNIMYRQKESTGTFGISNNHDSFLGDGAGNAAYNNYQPPDFTWSNMYMILDTISFADDFYRALLAERLQGGGIITIPYPNYFTFTKAMTSSSDTMSFNLATQSLDVLMATFRNMKYIQRNGKRYSENAQNTNFYKFVSADNTDYTQGVFTHKTSYQFMVNNKLMPSWPVNVDEAHALTRGAFDQVKSLPGNPRNNSYQFPTVASYRDGTFVFAQSLKHHDEEDKIISGLDTRGASSNMHFAVSDANVGVNDASNEGAYSQVQMLIFAMTTSTLEISAGQNVVTIF
jgi:hypothetical protein